MTDKLIWKTAWLGGRRIEIAAPYQEWLELAERALQEYQARRFRMRIRLVCDGTWDDNQGRRVELTGDKIELVLGDFHAGCTYEAEIELDPEQERELHKHMENGFRPLFYALPAGESSRCDHLLEPGRHAFAWEPVQRRNIWNPLHPKRSKCGKSIGELLGL